MMFTSMLSANKNWLYLLFILSIVLLVGIPNVWAEMETRNVEDVRAVYPSEWGVPHPEGITYSARNKLFFLLEKNPSEAATGESSVVVITPYENLASTTRFNFNIGDTINIAFDDSANRLFLLGGSPLQLIQVTAGDDGALDPASETRLDASRFGLINPEGMTVDVGGKFLFILDRSNSQVVRIDLSGAIEQASFVAFDLAEKGLGGLRGIAVNNETHHLFVMNPSKQMIYELSADFKYQAQYDIESLGLVDPMAFVFADSPDLTDDEKTLHLFIADSNLPTPTIDEPLGGNASSFRTFLPAIFQGQGNSEAAQEDDSDRDGQEGALGRIVEINLEVAPESPEAINAASADLTLVLVQTIQTSAFSPPSPDPSGITYVPGSPGRVFITDGEVEEMPIFAANNLWTVTLPNSPAGVGNTSSFTSEPTDVAYDAANQRYFISDDDTRRIFEVYPGADGVIGTTDDLRTFFDTAAFGSTDPEGLDYANGELWIADGVNREVYRVNPGPNGIFNGVPAAGGDDIVSQFDVNTLSVGDPEGIDYVTPGDYLLLTGRSANLIYELALNGTFIRSHSISAAGGVKLAGIVLAPASNDPNKMNYWIVDRGIDNNDIPTENDGRIFEFTTPATNPTPTPTPPPPPPATIYFSSADDGTIGGVTYSDEDILTHNTVTGAYALLFDGSAHGVTSDVRAFERLSDETLLLNFISNITVPGLGAVEINDIVRFHPTTGLYSWYFDGSDLGLTAITKGIDALTVVPDLPFDQVLISFAEARLDLPLGGIITRVNDEDILRFTPSQPLGQDTAGTLSFYFDGSDVQLSSSDSEDIKGLWVNPSNGELYLNTYGVFGVTGVSGDGSDVFVCTPGNPPGEVTTCTYRMFWDGSRNGFTQIMDSVSVQLQ